ncbi:MAG: hypothetical protein AAF985_15085 [Bacteroidota bacterium]
MVEHRENLEAVEQLLQPFKKMLGEAVDTVLVQEVSSYPIFVVAQESLSMGIPLIKAGQLSDGWLVHISTLEEFAAKKLVDMEKVNDFKTVYKKPTDYLCLFVIEDIGATFVFLPRS